MIRPSEFLAQAKWLISQNPCTEALSRSAISRGYYSLFHEAYNLLPTNHPTEYETIVADHIRRSGKRPDIPSIKRVNRTYLKYNVNMHAVLADVLSQLNFGLGSDFCNLRDERNRADYELNRFYPNGFADTMVRDAERIINLLPTV